MTDMSPKRTVDWLFDVLEGVVASPVPDFAGVGVLVYRPPLNLPVTPLRPGASNSDSHERFAPRQENRSREDFSP